MPPDEELARRIRDALAARSDVQEKRMFGGVAFMVRGHMAAGTAKGKLMLRVGTEQHEALLAKPHVEPMDFTGRSLRGFIYVKPEGYRTATALRSWLAIAVQTTEHAPPKTEKKSKAKIPAKRRASAPKKKAAR